MSKSNKKAQTVYRLIDEGKSDSYILARTQISIHQLSAYKGSKTRQENDPFVRLEQYMKGKRVLSLSTKSITKRIRPDQVSSLVEILDTILSEEPEQLTETQPVQKTKARNNGYDKDAARTVVSQLVSKGTDYGKIYSNPRLQGIPRTSITAFIAHASRGSYND